MIMAVTGQKNESSLRSYNSDNTNKQKKTISHCLSGPKPTSLTQTSSMSSYSVSRDVNVENNIVRVSSGSTSSTVVSVVDTENSQQSVQTHQNVTSGHNRSIIFNNTHCNIYINQQ